MFAMIETTPDLVFVLIELSKYSMRPGKNHVVGGTKVLICLEFSRDYHLEFSRGSDMEK
jgi:hypothetical protein